MIVFEALLAPALSRISLYPWALLTLCSLVLPALPSPPAPCLPADILLKSLRELLGAMAKLQF